MRILLLLLFLLPHAGCGVFGPELEVLVTDPAGAPIARAAVTPVTASMNGRATLTDSAGKATIPRNQIQDVQWVSVTAEGFTSRHETVPRDPVLRITLSPKGQADQPKSDK